MARFQGWAGSNRRASFRLDRSRPVLGGLVGAGRERTRPRIRPLLPAPSLTTPISSAPIGFSIDEPLTGGPSTARTRMSALSRLPTCLMWTSLPRHATPTCRYCAICTASRAPMRASEWPDRWPTHLGRSRPPVCLSSFFERERQPVHGVELWRDWPHSVFRQFPFDLPDRWAPESFVAIRVRASAESLGRSDGAEGVDRANRDRAELCAIRLMNDGRVPIGAADRDPIPEANPQTAQDLEADWGPASALKHSQ
jgi:hypothetical protein